MNSTPVQQPSPAPKKSARVWIIILIVLLILCCLCSILMIGVYFGYDYFLNLTTNIGEQISANPLAAENSPQSSDESGITPAQPLIKLPNPFGVTLGDETRCARCGYSFKLVPGYDYNNDWITIQTMKAPGVSDENGPILTLAGGPPSKEITSTDDLIKQFIPQTEGVTYTPPKKIKVGGVTASSVDMEGTLEGVAIKGRFVIALISPKQIFVMTGFAPTDKWTETQSYFEAVLDSVTFFEPEPAPTEQP